jgi:hypothetical protein
MRSETSFDLEGDLIFVDAVVVGPRGQADVRLVLDHFELRPQRATPSVISPTSRIRQHRPMLAEHLPPCRLQVARIWTSSSIATRGNSGGR